MLTRSDPVGRGCNSVNGEAEYIEEVQSGDKKLTYYKRKHLSVTSDTSTSVSPSSQVPVYGYNKFDGNNITWRSEDNILPTYSEAVRSLKEKKENEQACHSANHVGGTHTSYFPRSYSISPDLSNLYPAENQFHPEYFVESREDNDNVDDVSLISSAHSACSFSRRYLDASMDQYKHAAIDCPPSLLEREARGKSRTEERDGNVQCDPEEITNYYVTQSQTCPSSGVLKFPFDHIESNKENAKDGKNRASQLSMDVVKRRHEICKYIALFCVLVVTVVCLLTGILFYYVGFYPQVVHLNKGDVGILSLPLFFCGEVLASSLSGNLLVHELIKGVTTTHRRNVVAGNIEVYPADIWFRDFYLQSGSSVEVVLASEYALEALVFAGEQQYLEWIRGKSDSYSHKFNTMVSGVNDILSDLEHTKQRRNFTAERTERFFIVVRNKMDYMQIARAHMQLTFDRVIYNTTGKIQGCKSSPGHWCSLSSDFNNRGVFLMEVPLAYQSSTLPQSSEVTYKCTARVWLFVLVFLCTFLLCVILVACFYLLVVHNCLLCCAADEHNEKCISPEFLYLNKHTINSLQGHWNNNADMSSEAAGRTAQTNSNHFDPVVEHSATLNVPSLETTHNQSGPSSDASRYHFDVSSQSLSLDPEASRRQEIMQMQELQLQQFRSRELNQPHEVKIIKGPRIKQLLSSDSVPNGHPQYFVNPSLNRTRSSQDNLGYERSSPDKLGTSQRDVLHTRERDIIQIPSSEDGEEVSPPFTRELGSSDEELYQFALQHPGRRSDSAELFV